MTVATTLAVVFGALGTAAASGRHDPPPTAASEPRPARIAAPVGDGAMHELAPPPTAAQVQPTRDKPKPKSKPIAAKKPKKIKPTKKPRIVERADRSTRRPPPPVGPDWVRPGTGVLSSGFGPRWGTIHYGIDLAAPYGSPIYAAGDGVVVRAGPASGFGLAIYIRHQNGDVTVYGHEYEVLVSTGQRVEAGQLIAHVGSEGYSTGPHLHFGVYQGGLEGPRIDPIPWLAKRGVKI